MVKYEKEKRERKPFEGIWEDMGPISRRKIFKDFQKYTGLSEEAFWVYRKGKRRIPVKVITIIEQIFKNHGYENIWDPPEDDD